MGATQKAVREYREWIDYCKATGWAKADLGPLTDLWWKYHDDQGNLITPPHEPARHEWRSIESAPTDGTHVLIYCEGWADGSEAWYIPDHGWYLANVDHTDNHGRAFFPSLWMPLPLAPSRGGGGE